jgi:hypothetical protein
MSVSFFVIGVPGARVVLHVLQKPLKKPHFKGLYSGIVVLGDTALVKPYKITIKVFIEKANPKSFSTLVLMLLISQEKTK